MAVTSRGRGGGGSEDSQGRVRGGGQGQVPPGGSHHGTVQTPQCGGDVWNDNIEPARKCERPVADSMHNKVQAHDC